MFEDRPLIGWGTLITLALALVIGGYGIKLLRGRKCSAALAPLTLLPGLFGLFVSMIEFQRCFIAMIQPPPVTDLYYFLVPAVVAFNPAIVGVATSILLLPGAIFINSRKQA